MCDSQYTELHCHSTFSLLDGVGTLEHGARRAAELGHPAKAMSEHKVLSGTVHHLDACREVGIKPIVGLEAYYRPKRVTTKEVEVLRKSGQEWEHFQPYYHMLLLAKDVRGWRSLKLLSSESYRSGFYRQPCIDDELLDKYNEGLIISTTCASGFIPRAITRGDDAAVRSHIEKLNRWVGDDWFFEVQPHLFEDQVILNLEIPRLAAADGHPVVCTRDAHAPEPDWIETQHVSVKMRMRGSMVEEPKKKSDDVDEKYNLTAAPTAYIASAEQTRKDFLENHPRMDPRIIDESISNTGYIAGKVMPWIMDRTPKMPRYRSTHEEDYQELRRQVFAGLEQLGKHEDPSFTEAVEKELKIYRERDVCAFFLFVSEMIRWLRSTEGLPSCAWDKKPPPTKMPEKVGVRGSAGGCRVAYALRITLINPNTYDLSFERFLNPDRAGVPDIDIDLTPHGAGLAKEYLKRRQGPDKVYDMIAHATFGAKESLKRVARVYGITDRQMNAITKKIDDGDSDMPLEQLCEHVPELQRYAEDNPDAFKHSSRLQKSISKVTEHAAGVVISDIPLDEIIPVMKKSAKDDYLVTAFGNAADKETISDLGLLKLDLLVVVALARQSYAEQLIEQVHGVQINLDTLPAFEDPMAVDEKAMDIFRMGAKNGIFQWDGRSNMATLTKRIKPEGIHHLAAANAGVRPGVSQHSEEYVRRRHGAEFEYWDPSVIPALKETYGLPLYQEQIMAIFQLLGGYSAGEADTVRRIMAKYYRIKGGVAAQMLGEYEERFVENAASVCHGGKVIADQIWNYCGRSSEYLFNAAHAKGYSLTAYCDAWLKAHYPDAFYASLLTFPPAWVKKPENRNSFYERNVREARSFGITIKPPDVNESDSNFTIHGDSVRFGFSGIKGLGPAMVADILNNRPFASMEDMGARLTACNVAGRQALGAAGALDRFGARDNLTLDERAAAEENRIGVALSGEDRMAPVREKLQTMLHTQDEFEEAPNGKALVVGGEITYGKEIQTKTGDPALKLTIVFGANEYPVSFAPWDYTDQVRDLIASDQPVVVRGSKDSEWECVSASEIKAASEVLDMMSLPA